MFVVLLIVFSMVKDFDREQNAFSNVDEYVITGWEHSRELSTVIAWLPIIGDFVAKFGDISHYYPSALVEGDDVVAAADPVPSGTNRDVAHGGIAPQDETCIDILWRL